MAIVESIRPPAKKAAQLIGPAESTACHHTLERLAFLFVQNQIRNHPLAADPYLTDSSADLGLAPLLVTVTAIASPPCALPGARVTFPPTAPPCHASLPTTHGVVADGTLAKRAGTAATVNLPPPHLSALK